MNAFREYVMRVLAYDDIYVEDHEGVGAVD